MNCKKCGAPLDNNSGFCGICGTPIEPQTNAAPEIFNIEPTAQPEIAQAAPSAQPAAPAQAAQPIPTPEVIPTVESEMVQPVEPVPTVEPEMVQPVQPMPTVESEMVQPVQPVPTVEPEMVQPVEPVPTVEPEMVQPVEPVPTVEPEMVQPVQPVPTVDPVNMNNGVVPPIDTNNGVVPPTPSYEPEKKKHSALPAILILLIVVAGVAFCIYKFLFNKPDKVVKGLINKAYDKLEAPLKKYDSNNDSVLINADLTINTNFEGAEDLNGMKFNITSGIDYKNNKFEMGLSYLEDNNKIIEALMYVLDENAYVVLKDIYPNPIKVNSESVDLKEVFEEKATTSPEDIDFLAKRFKNILIESLDMNDFKQSSDTITLNGSETKVKKISYTLDSAKTKKLVNKLIDGMISDNEFMTKLAEMNDTTVEDLKEEMLDSKIESDDVLEGKEIKIDIYTKGVTDEFVGFDVELETATNVKVRKNNNNTVINAMINGVTADITITKESEEKCTADIKVDVFTEQITGLLTIENKEIDDKTTESKITFNMKYQEQEIGYTLNMKQQIGANIADIDVLNAKSSDELTNEEMTLIEQKLTEKLMNSKLYNLVMGSYGNTYGDYGLDYNSEL